MRTAKEVGPFAIGIDLGGTKIAGALVSHDGRIGFKESLLTLPEEPVESVLQRIVACAERLQAEVATPIAGIGIGTPAMTDSRRGIVIHASNLRWTNVPLRDLVVDRLGATWNERVWVDKDTNAAALGEMLYGAGRDSRHLLYVTIGTGVGGGMVLDGHLYHGASEGASDIGHMVLDPEGEVCGCGKRGCLETIASGPAIVRQARTALLRGEASALSVLDWGSISARDVVDSAKEGDDLARAVLVLAGHSLGVALAYYVDINNPELILIGGGVAAAGELLLGPIRERIGDRALPANARNVKVIPAGLGPDSGAIGAAALVWHHLAQQSYEAR